MSDERGWYPDPFGLHEWRYLSGGVPTKLVRDQGVESYDEPPARVPTRQADSITRLPDRGVENLVGPAQESSVETTDLREEAEVRVAADEPPAAEQLIVPSDLAPAPHSRRRGKWVLTSAVAACLVGAALIIGLHGSGQPIPSAADAAFVVSATNTTLNRGTAHLVISGTISGSGQSLPISGSGEALLSNPREFAADVRIPLPRGTGTSLQEKEVVVNGDFYLQVISDGVNQVSSLVFGKQWVQIPTPVLSNSHSIGLGTSDPLAQLQLLAAQGNTVTSLGTQSIRGVTSSGYAVAISRRNELRANQEFLFSSGLGAETQKQISRLAQNAPIPTIDVWIDRSNVIRQIGEVVNENENGTNVAIDVVIDVVDYGGPIAISTPSPADVVSYSQFIAADGAAGGTDG